MSIKFITFGSHANHIEAANRLIKQANESEVFDETILYTAEDLKNDQIFWNQHSEFILNNKRGYGYWLWKPYLIKKTIEQMKDGDILLYADAGCEIDIRKQDTFSKCIEIVKTDKILSIPSAGDQYYTKMDLIEKLNMNSKKYLNTAQQQAGVVLYLACNETRNLVNEWYNLGCDYHNIDDTPSIIRNLVEFKCHRHDQSIFSLLVKKNNLCSKHNLKCDFIRVIRNKSGISKLQ